MFIVHCSFVIHVLITIMSRFRDQNICISVRGASSLDFSKYLGFCHKNAILDGCSTVDSMLDYDGIGWYSMVLHGIQWYLAIE